MTRALGWAIVFALAISANAADAHTRSQSFSSWRLNGDTLDGVFSVPASEATRLAAQDDARLPLADLLARHLARTIGARTGDDACVAESPPSPLASSPGRLRAELRFRCGTDRPLRLEIAAFASIAPSHTHFARFTLDGAPEVELLFSDRARVREAIARENAPPAGASFIGYVRLGIEHIASGPDHLAFLLALLLFAVRARDVVVIVTGFTLGHSLTLALGALGIARPDPSMIEALIGFTIALVAAENLASPSGASARMSGAVGLVLVGLALAAIFSDRGPPPVLLLGLAFFTACYGRLAPTPAAAQRLRPAVTVLFGLVHGFGFAGVLLEVGLPRDRLLAALFGFNLGVEIGQLAFVAVFASTLALLRRLAPVQLRAIGREIASAGLCGLGLYWFVQRGYALLSP